MGLSVRFQQILGVRFIVGDAHSAIDELSRAGGLVVVPAAPALTNLVHDKGYREALLGADFALADSALMVAAWNLMQGDHIPKVSGLKYLRALIQRPEFCEAGSSFWVMPTEHSARRNVKWLNDHGVHLEHDSVYLAPMYDAVFEDEELLGEIEKRRPRHIVVGLGGGTQELLGLYLKRNLSYKPAIHCIGAAIAFLSGDQVRIPVWVDHAGLGWLWRSASNPPAYIPRYWAARRLVPMMLRYRDRLPSMAAPPVPLRTALPAAPVER
ncbi:MAG TPA: WecB/TagA/CpsF family glycosyltransferase [Terracidiphilus sp.]|jgi:UDP-N-acetyl-D-mannosaminuronic acid transferase (WecB/TagA/CpsF family)